MLRLRGISYHLLPLIIRQGFLLALNKTERHQLGDDFQKEVKFSPASRLGLSFYLRPFRFIGCGVRHFVDLS